MEPINFFHGNLKECQKKVLKIHRYQTNSSPLKRIDDCKLPKIKFDENCLKQDRVFSSFIRK